MLLALLRSKKSANRNEIFSHQQLTDLKFIRLYFFETNLHLMYDVKDALRFRISRISKKAIFSSNQSLKIFLIRIFKFQRLQRELSHVNVIFFSFQGYSDIRESPFFKRMEILIFDTHWRPSAIISPYKFTQRHSSEDCLFSVEKTCATEC